MRIDRAGRACRGLATAFFVAIASLAVGGPVAAQGVDDTTLSRMISAGQIDAARTALLQSDPTEAQRLFFEGRVLKAVGRLDEAIALFRAALQSDPNLLNARRELAHTLLLAENYRAAEHHFEALLDTDPNPEMRAGYRQFLAVIDANRPVSFQGFGAVMPSTNVNRGSANQGFDTIFGTFAIDANSRAQSGVGFQFGVSGQLRHTVAPQSRIILDWSLARTVYHDASFNSIGGNVGLFYDRMTESGRWSIGAFQRRTWTEDDTDLVANGLRFALRHEVADRLFGTVSLLAENRDYRSMDTQDGWFYSASVGLTRQIQPSLAISGGLTWERSLPGLAHLQYSSYSLTADLTRTWDGGFFTRLDIGAGFRDFDGVFPLTSSPREDQFARIGIDLRATQIDLLGFAPRVMCSHTINRSNVALYDYDATECQLGLSRNF